MVDDAKNFITPEGLASLKKEYEELTQVQRPKLLKKVSDLRSMGDLSENEAYHQARRQQAFLDGRVKELEEILKTAVVTSRTKSSSVQLGSRVVVEVDGEEQELVIVGENEADLLQGRISIASPLGGALLGKKVGEVVVVNAPAGKIEYKIVKVD